MSKQRKSKRQLIRDEKRAKKRGRELEKEQEGETTRVAKRQRMEGEASEDLDYIALDDGEEDGYDSGHAGQQPDRLRGPEREFFGVLSDEEQEYFRHADEMLELNLISPPEERDIFLQNVYKEAQGKELKLACSQSCSRLMERLILLSSPRQKKSLFEAFAGHFITLVTHRFASHCCEKLFIQSAQVVTDELGGIPGNDADGGDGDGEDDKPSSSMEDLFLLTLDELDGYLSYLLSDRYGSHTLRVLLVILSGKPIDQVSTRSLLQSRKKEHVTIQGVSTQVDESNSQVRAVPSSFAMAVKKIIADSTASMDATALRLLAKHPTGNPVLQLLLELDIGLSYKEKGRASEGDDSQFGRQDETLLDKLLPGIPSSLSDSASPASEFVSSMLYDPIGSRLLETLITHCPGKIFKPIQANFFANRIQSLLRNEIAMYPAIRVLNRLSREDLSNAVQKCVPEVPAYVERGRFNVLKTLFERCDVRHAREEIDSLLRALSSACGGDYRNLVHKLCALGEVGEGPAQQSDDDEEEATFQREAKTKTSALVHHGSQLIVTLLGILGQPSRAVQTSLLSLTGAQLLHMATSSGTTANVLITALSTPVPQGRSQTNASNFHKVLIATLVVPHAIKLALSRPGHAVLNAVIAAPSKASGANSNRGANDDNSGGGSGAFGIVVPFHAKENIMAKLADHETELRESWLGRSVWRTWRGDLWQHRRHDWVRWAREVDPLPAQVAAVPKPRAKMEGGPKEEEEEKERRGDGRGARVAAGRDGKPLARKNAKQPPGKSTATTRLGTKNAGLEKKERKSVMAGAA